MRNRFWGEAVDKAAQQQLELPENYTVVMMANTVEYVEDGPDTYSDDEESEEWFEGLSANEAVDKAMEERVSSVELPGNLHLVGLIPIEQEGPRPWKLGIVDFTGVDWPGASTDEPAGG